MKLQCTSFLEMTSLDMWIWIANKFAKFYTKRCNHSENIPKSISAGGGGYFFWNILHFACGVAGLYAKWVLSFRQWKADQWPPVPLRYIRDAWRPCCQLYPTELSLLVSQGMLLYLLGGPCGSCSCYRICPIHFLAGWCKRRPEPGLVWFH